MMNNNVLIYGNGTSDPIEGLEKVVDLGTMVINLPKHYFFKDGRFKKKYFKRSTYPNLKKVSVDKKKITE